MRLLTASLALLSLALVAWPSQAAAQDGCGLSDAEDRVVVTGGARVEADETAGDLIVIDGDVDVAGRVAGDVVAAAGDVRISGCVGGDVTTFAGRATLAPSARVEGDVVYSEEQPVIGPGAEVGGEIRDEDWGDIGDAPWAIIGAAALWLAVSLSLLVAGTALVAVFPKAAEAAYEAVRSQGWLTVAMGLAVLVGLPLVAGLAFVTLVGIPLGIILGLALLPLAAIGYLVACFVIGRAVTNQDVHPILAFLAGLGILRAVALIPIAGGLAWIPAVIVGLGALVVAAMPNGSKARAA